MIKWFGALHCSPNSKSFTPGFSGLYQTFNSFQYNASLFVPAGQMLAGMTFMPYYMFSGFSTTFWLFFCKICSI